MWRLDRRTCATLALMTLASLAGITPVDAQGEAVRESMSTGPPRARGRPRSARPRRDRAAVLILRARRLSMPLHAGVRCAPAPGRERSPRWSVAASRAAPGACRRRSPSRRRRPSARGLPRPRRGPGPRRSLRQHPQRHGRAHYSAGSHEPHLRQRRTRPVYARLPTPCLAPIRQSVRVRDVRAGGAIPRGLLRLGARRMAASGHAMPGVGRCNRGTRCTAPCSRRIRCTRARICG